MGDVIRPKSWDNYPDRYVPMNYLDGDGEWTPPVCDHRGTMRRITEHCECGHKLCEVLQPAEATE